MDYMLDLPKDLQDDIKELLILKEQIEKKLEGLRAKVQKVRQECRHRAAPGGHFATYCEKCGDLIDTWL